MMRTAACVALLAVGPWGCRTEAQSRVDGIARPIATVVVVPVGDTSVGGAMRRLASRAGMVFVGQVIRVEHRGGVVEITFKVDEVVQGKVGATYTLREWGGLWIAGQQRYPLGQRAMFFLRTPTDSGLSSPVDGMDGVVPVVPMGGHAAPLLDVRRLATRVQRAVGEPMRGEAVALTDAVTAVRGGAQEPSLQRLPSGWLPKPVGRPVPVLELGVSDVAR